MSTLVIVAIVVGAVFAWATLATLTYKLIDPRDCDVDEEMAAMFASVAWPLTWLYAGANRTATAIHARLTRPRIPRATAKEEG